MINDNVRDSDIREIIKLNSPTLDNLLALLYLKRVTENGIKRENLLFSIIRQQSLVVSKCFC
jgi:hypothetical protein